MSDLMELSDGSRLELKPDDILFRSLQNLSSLSLKLALRHRIVELSKKYCEGPLDDAIRVRQHIQELEKVIKIAQQIEKEVLTDVATRR